MSETQRVTPAGAGAEPSRVVPSLLAQSSLPPSFPLPRPVVGGRKWRSAVASSPSRYPGPEDSGGKRCPWGGRHGPQGRPGTGRAAAAVCLLASAMAGRPLRAAVPLGLQQARGESSK